MANILEDLLSNVSASDLLQLASINSTGTDLGTGQRDIELNDKTLLKKIINSRLEEIVELLFLNCPLIKNNFFNSELKLFFIGNGSKVLNDNLLTFGQEFNFINEMSIIDEKNINICDSAFKFNSENEKIQPQETALILENKGFFEKLFEYFTKK